MKLRIKGNSVRLRVTRPDMVTLMDCGHIEETVYFAADEDARLVYALRHDPNLPDPTLLYRLSEVAIGLPTRIAREWAGSEQVGIYYEVDLGPRGVLNLIVEKDFACLNPGHGESTDAFPNPNAGAAC